MDITLENRVYRMEDRFQLMELLLNSYYLNDEVFRSLDQAIKRDNQERRSSSLMNMNDKDTDFVLRNNVLNEEFDEVPDVYIGESGSGTIKVKRGPSSSTTFSPDDVPLEFLYDEEHKIGSKL